MDVLMICLGIFFTAAFFYICGRQRKPIKAMAANSASGIVLLILSAAISGFLGCGIPVNYATVIIASGLGIPGVIMLLLIKFII